MQSYLEGENENQERNYAPKPTTDDSKPFVLLILIFITILGIVCLCWYSEKSQVIDVAMIFIMSAVFILVLFFSLSYPKFSYENHLLRLLITESKFILYSHGDRMSIFDRSIFRYDFIGENELVLLEEEEDPQKVVTVNLWQLSEDEKQELKSILEDNSMVLETNSIPKKFITHNS